MILRSIQHRLDLRRLILLMLCACSSSAVAANLDTIGVTVLRATTTNLDGRGLRAGQVEALENPATAAWEVAPFNESVLLPAGLFTWYSTNASATNFPNGLGSGSLHASFVGGLFYGPPIGVSTNVAHIDNFEADYFFFTQVPDLLPVPDRVVNQSFTAPNSYQGMSDTAYDNFAAQYNVLFVSAAGDAIAPETNVLPPSTCYNGISVGGSYLGSSSIGPTLDGRAKPDICAPGDTTSYSAPLVSGSALLLMQAGMRGDGGNDTNSAADVRTIKALLLNGAVKPPAWTNAAPSPLDPAYGAGVVNVFNSYRQLVGGRRNFITNSTVLAGHAHPPTSSTSNVPALAGWDFNTIAGNGNYDSINHYCFNVAGTNGAGVTATITLAWNRQFLSASIRNLDLFVYNMATGGLVASSVSTVDNVEHVYLPTLPPGRYDVEVLKHAAGGADSETYALAFDFSSIALSIAPAANGFALSWPIYPEGWNLFSNGAALSPGQWNVVPNLPVLTNNQFRTTIPLSSNTTIFRLLRQP